MAQHPKHSREVVHLYADGEEEEGEFAFGARYNAAAQSQEYEDVNDLLQELNQRYSPEFGAADIFVDLTNISDRDSPPPALAARRVEFARISVPEPNHITEAVCLQMILDVLPDICIEHALGLIKANTQENTRTPAQCENIISQLLDEDSYPKEADQAKDKKRKRVDEEEWSRYEKGEVAKYPPTYASEV